MQVNRKRPVCPRDGSQFVPGRVSRLSQGRFLFVPDTVRPEMFRFIGFFFWLNQRFRMADCVNSSPPLISRKFRGFGGIWAISGKFGKFRENSGEFSGIQYGA